MQQIPHLGKEDIESKKGEEKLDDNFSKKSQMVWRHQQKAPVNEPPNVYKEISVTKN